MKNIIEIEKFKKEFKDDLNCENFCSMNTDEFKEYFFAFFEKLNSLKIHSGAELTDFNVFVENEIISKIEVEDEKCQDRISDLCLEVSSAWSASGESNFWNTDFEIYKINLIKMLENHNY